MPHNDIAELDWQLQLVECLRNTIGAEDIVGKLDVQQPVLNVVRLRSCFVNQKVLFWAFAKHLILQPEFVVVDLYFLNTIYFNRIKLFAHG